MKKQKNNCFKQELGDFADELFHAGSFDTAFKSFDEFIQKLGYEGVLYSFIPRIILQEEFSSAPVFQVSDTYSPDFMRHYFAARFDRDDSIIKLVGDGFDQPLDWWKEARNGNFDSSGMKILDVAKHDYQVSNGLTIPTMCGADGIAGTSVISAEDDRLFRLLRQETDEAMETSARMFHAAVMSSPYYHNTFIEPLLSHLNATEIRVLKRLAHGSTIPAVAEHVGRTVRYTDKVIRNIRIKLGGLTEEGRPAMSTRLLQYYVGLMNLRDEL